MENTPRGCSNVGGSPARRLEYCRNKCMEIFTLYGYQPFSAAELQLTEDVFKKISPHRARRLLSVSSPFGQPCVLRGDITLSAVSYLSRHFKKEEYPIRLCYADRVYSVPKPPRDNIEENQAGVELVGCQSEAAHLEIIWLLLAVLDALSLDDAIIVLGDTDVTSEILSKAGDSKDALIDALQNGSYVEYQNIISSIGLSDNKLLFELPYLKGDVSLLDDVPVMSGALNPMKNLISSLSKLGYASRLRLDLGFIRDLGYYGGPIFNVYASEEGALLGGGGEYHGILTKLGISCKGIGFGLNLKELADCCMGDYPRPNAMLWCSAEDDLAYARKIAQLGVHFELSWHDTKEASINLSLQRGYKWWIGERIALRLEDNLSHSLCEFEREAALCSR